MKQLTKKQKDILYAMEYNDLLKEKQRILEVLETFKTTDESNWTQAQKMDNIYNNEWWIKRKNYVIDLISTIEIGRQLLKEGNNHSQLYNEWVEGKKGEQKMEKKTTNTYKIETPQQYKIEVVVTEQRETITYAEHILILEMRVKELNKAPKTNKGQLFYAKKALEHAKERYND